MGVLETATEGDAQWLGLQQGKGASRSGPASASARAALAAEPLGRKRVRSQTGRSVPTNLRRPGPFPSFDFGTQLSGIGLLQPLTSRTLGSEPTRVSLDGNRRCEPCAKWTRGARDPGSAPAAPLKNGPEALHGWLPTPTPAACRARGQPAPPLSHRRTRAPRLQDVRPALRADTWLPPARPSPAAGCGGCAGSEAVQGPVAVGGGGMLRRRAGTWVASPLLSWGKRVAAREDRKAWARGAGARGRGCVQHLGATTRGLRESGPWSQSRRGLRGEASRRVGSGVRGEERSGVRPRGGRHLQTPCCKGH